MYRGLSVLALAPVLNEEAKIGEVVRRTPRSVADEVLVVDDGSRDRSAEAARAEGATVLSLGTTLGVGAAIRRGFDYALERKYDVAVVMAGNNKDAPEELPRLLDPIADGRADLVQGSRYLGRRRALGPMPYYRRVATRIHPLLLSAITGQRFTDSTNGFRAVRTRLLADQRVRLGQPWLDQYELEPYLLYKALDLGYRVVEVPVTKIYPPKALGQTKMPPVTGWWSMLRPLVLLGFHLRD
jgi:dolichol-phosphate mannosyltransferase